MPLHLVAYFVAYSYCGRGAAWLRFFIAIATATLLSLMGFTWNELGGAFFMPLLGLVFFLAGGALVSQSLFPMLNWTDRFKAVRLFFGYMFDSHRDCYLVGSNEHQTATEEAEQKLKSGGAADKKAKPAAAKDKKAGGKGKPAGKPKPAADKKGVPSDKRISGHQGSRAGTGLIRVGVGKAAVLQTAVQFSRIVPPGTSYLHRFEKVKTVVDLHTQLRATKAQAVTKDAVPVEAPLYCLFRIAPNVAPQRGEDGFGFSEEKLRQVVFGQEGVAEENEEYYWDDYVLQIVMARFREILGRFRLDQLFEPDDPDQVPRLMLTSTLNTAVRNDLEKRGIDLVYAGFGTLSFAEPIQGQILDQRIDSWKAQWEARAAGRRAAGEAEAERLRQAARAAAQWELVQGMINGLEAARGLTNIEPAELVTWQLLNAMESMSADPALQPLIPQETLNALIAIRDWLEETD